MTDNTKHNQAPAHEEHAATIRELEVEAEAFCTGADIPDQATADALGELLGKVRAAEKAAEDARKAEKAPHIAAGKEVDAAYKPCLETAKLIQKSAKPLLAKWMRVVEAEQQRIAEEARQEAERQKEEARVAMLTSAGDIEARRQAEALTAEAAKTERLAKRAAKTGSSVQAGGRKIALRTSYDVVLTDEQALVKWYWRVSRPQILEAALSEALAHVRSCGGKVSIPGVEIVEEKVAA